MNDYELLELAAKAAGILFNGFDSFYEDYSAFDAELDVDYQWNPPDSDGDALRLAAQLSFSIEFHDTGSSYVVRPGYVYCHRGRAGDGCSELYGEDKQAATRRAIVGAVAELGKAML